MAGAVEKDLFVLGPDAKRRVVLRAGLEPGGERIAILDDFPIRDVASHKGFAPL